jgi:hypothetical protein
VVGPVDGGPLTTGHEWPAAPTTVGRTRFVAEVGPAIAERLPVTPDPLALRLDIGLPNSVPLLAPATRAGGAVEEAGTVLRPATVRRYAERAGFDRVEVVPITHDLWRCYRLGAR